MPSGPPIPLRPRQASAWPPRRPAEAARLLCARLGVGELPPGLGLPGSAPRPRRRRTTFRQPGARDPGGSGRDRGPAYAGTATATSPLLRDRGRRRAVTLGHRESAAGGGRGDGRPVGRSTSQRPGPCVQRLTRRVPLARRMPPRPRAQRRPFNLAILVDDPDRLVPRRCIGHPNGNRAPGAPIAGMVAAAALLLARRLGGAA